MPTRVEGTLTQAGPGAGYSPRRRAGRARFGPGGRCWPAAWPPRWPAPASPRNSSARCRTAGTLRGDSERWGGRNDPLDPQHPPGDRGGPGAMDGGSVHWGSPRGCPARPMVPSPCVPPAPLTADLRHGWGRPGVPAATPGMTPAPASAPPPPGHAGRGWEQGFTRTL